MIILKRTEYVNKQVIKSLLLQEDEPQIMLGIPHPDLAKLLSGKVERKKTARSAKVFCFTKVIKF